jgi:hypothetical protein
VAFYVGSDRVDLGASDIEKVLCVGHFVRDENVLLQMCLSKVVEVEVVDGILGRQA